MPIRLIPELSDQESDLETQLLMMGAILTGNLMTVALLRHKLQRQREPGSPSSSRLYTALPKISAGLFASASLYFLALSRKELRDQPGSTSLLAVFAANLLSTAAVGLKTCVVFSASPGAETPLDALEP